jgi:hypothetical protein
VIPAIGATNKPLESACAPILIGPRVFDSKGNEILSPFTGKKNRAGAVVVFLRQC